MSAYKELLLSCFHTRDFVLENIDPVALQKIHNYARGFKNSFLPSPFNTLML